MTICIRVIHYCGLISSSQVIKQVSNTNTSTPPYSDSASLGSSNVMKKSRMVIASEWHNFPRHQDPATTAVDDGSAQVHQPRFTCVHVE